MKTSVAEKEVHFFENADDFRTATTILSGEKKPDSLLGKVDLLSVGNIEILFLFDSCCFQMRIKKQNEDEDPKN